jgi:hypothetical protein
MSFAEKLKKRVNEVAETVISLIKTVDDETQKSRLDICYTCPHLTKLTHQCKKCGCFMNLKTKLSEAKCPENKW